MQTPSSTIPVQWRADGANHAKLTTDELAAMLRLKAQTIRAGLCRKGEFMGLRPHKLPNGRLLWDGRAAEQLVSPRAGRGAE